MPDKQDAPWPDETTIKIPPKNQRKVRVTLATPEPQQEVGLNDEERAFVLKRLKGDGYVTDTLAQGRADRTSINQDYPGGEEAEASDAYRKAMPGVLAALDALDTPQPESGGVEEARLADLFDSVEDAAYIREAIERGKSPEAEAIQLLRKFMCCKAGRDWVLVGLIQPFAHAFTQPPQVGLSAEERERLQHIADSLQAERAGVRGDAAFLRSLADQKGEG